MSGGGNIVAHWASAPFDKRELKDPVIKAIMNSDDVMGGSTTFTMMSTTSRFQSENPKVFGAVVKALKRAQEMIAADKPNAAAVLLEAMGGKGWMIEDLVEILNDPGTKYTMKPENVLTYANFMHEIGSLKNKPASLTDLFFENPDIAGGN
jgi:NitT/TauT family transport system substrate-binding protein